MREGRWNLGARGYLTPWILEHNFLFKPGDRHIMPTNLILAPRISRPSAGSSELREGRKYDIGQTNLQVSTTCRDELMWDQLTF